MRRLYSFIKSKLFRVPQSGDPSSANPSPSRDKYLAYNAARARKVSQGQAYREAMADSKVLVYHYRANNRPVVRNGLAVITYEELTDILAASMCSLFIYIVCADSLTSEQQTPRSSSARRQSRDSRTPSTSTRVTSTPTPKLLLSLLALTQTMDRMSLV